MKSECGEVNRTPYSHGHTATNVKEIQVAEDKGRGFLRRGSTLLLEATEDRHVGSQSR